MNAAEAYRRAVYTTPLHSQLAQLHRQAAVFSKRAAEFVEHQDLESGRQHIQYVQDIISFLRSSLDMNLGEVSQKTDAVYAYYYQVMVNWFLDPTTIRDQVDEVIHFWESWAETWSKVRTERMNYG